MSKSMKRIHRVTIKRMYDESPDTSWLGEYSDTAKSEFTIDRQLEDGFDSRQFRYFNPGSVEAFDPKASWMPSGCKASLRHEYWRKTMRENARKDYERMESLTNGDFCFIGIRAEAEYSVGEPERPFYLLQTLTSGGLWGIESDSGNDYLASVEKEELAELRNQLKAVGFSTRAISTAFKNIEETGDAR